MERNLGKASETKERVSEGTMLQSIFENCERCPTNTRPAVDGMDRKLMEVFSRFGKPVAGIHEVRIYDGEIIEDFHIYVTGLELRGDGSTLDEALKNVLTAP